MQIVPQKRIDFLFSLNERLLQIVLLVLHLVAVLLEIQEVLFYCLQAIF